MDNMEALPRRSGELVFHEEWEKRIFAMVIILHEQGRFEWEEFKSLLIEQIKISGETFEKPDQNAPGYYEYWMNNLELMLDKVL